MSLLITWIKIYICCQKSLTLCLLYLMQTTVWMSLHTFRPTSVKPVVKCCPQQVVLKHLLSCFGSCSILIVRFRCSYKMIELILSAVFLPGGPLRGKLSPPDFSSLITRLFHFQAFDSSPPLWGIRWELLSQHFSHIPQRTTPFALFSSCKNDDNTLPYLDTYFLRSDTRRSIALIEIHLAK